MDTIKLKCLIGPYAGQVITYPADVGQVLLDQGQAALPDTGPRPAQAVETATEPEAETPEAPAERDLSKMSKAELYDLATERDIEGRSGMNKAELLEVLS